MLLVACNSERAAHRSAGPPGAESRTASNFPERPLFCDDGGSDQVHDVFCGTEPPKIASLRELEEAMQLAFPVPDGGVIANVGTSGEYGSPYVATTLLAHSTALSGALVSPINPRAIVLGLNSFLAFNRGVQQVEIASIDRNTAAPSFFLVTFEQACSASPAGCSPGDLFTPRIESNWTRVRARDAEALKDTPSDCRQCHQRGRDVPILLMRELHGPWNHFFAPDQGAPDDFPEPTGVDLLRDYLTAKGGETYAGIPLDDLRNTFGATLEGVVPFEQPVVFDGVAIIDERWYSRDGGPPGPVASTTPARSPTWYAAYDAFKRGEQLPLPYFASRPTDAVKQAKLTAAYQSYRAGDTDATELPDLSDIFPDDPQVRAEIGLETEPGASPAQALVQACGSCHNDVLDQSISRARFNVALSRMSRAELDEAITRLKTARDAPLAMPPSGRRQLDTDGLQKFITYLQRDTRSSDDDALLEHAARVGMTGGAEKN